VVAALCYDLSTLILLKIVKIIETFTFGFCTLWVPPRNGGGERRLIGKRSRRRTG
jgi:hypothetical protein